MGPSSLNIPRYSSKFRGENTMTDPPPLTVSKVHFRPILLLMIPPSTEPSIAPMLRIELKSAPFSVEIVTVPPLSSALMSLLKTPLLSETSMGSSDGDVYASVMPKLNLKTDGRRFRGGHGVGGVGYGG